MAGVTTDDWRRLSEELTGLVALPGDETYEAWRKPQLARFHDIHPQAIVRCRSTADVSAAVLFARRHEIATTVRSGGHDFAGRSSTTGVLIDLGDMNAVTLSGGVATVGAGTLLGDLYAALSAAGRAIPGGSCPTVGVGGLTLGGGLGWLGRSYGPTCDSLVRAEVVLPDGRVVWCGDEQHADLFWALRGAGTDGLGIVTTMVFDTVAAPDWTVFEGVWDYCHAARIVDVWQDWAPDAPDRFTASLLLRAPADSHQPPQVTMRGAAIGYSVEETDDTLDDVVQRAGVEPHSWQRKQTSWPDHDITPTAQTSDDEPPIHLFAKSEFFQLSLPEDAIDKLASLLITGRSDGEARELDFSAWGGAYTRRPVEATAFPHRNARFLLKHAVEVAARNPDFSPSDVAPSGWLGRSWEAVRPWGTGGVFPNFPDPELDHAARAYYGPNLDRLIKVRAEYGQ